MCVCVCVGGGGGGLYWNYHVSLSICLSVCVWLCPEYIFWTTQPFAAKPCKMVQTNWVAIFKVKVTQECLYIIKICFWSNDSFVIKFTLILDNHKPRCPDKWLDCCVQGQGHSKHYKLHLKSVWTTASEWINLWKPNLVWWCIIISRKNYAKTIGLLWSRSQGLYNQNSYDYFFFFFLLLILYLPSFIWWCIITSRTVLWSNCFAVFTVKVTTKVHRLYWMFVRMISSKLFIFGSQAYDGEASSWARVYC